MIKKAVIPAAGFGTRFLPATKSQPKEMLPIVDTPVIQYVVEEAAKSGINDILMIIGSGKRSIEEHFDRSFQLEAQLLEQGKKNELQAVKRISEIADIHFVWQKEAKGLGDAVYCARHHIKDEPFVILLGDTLMDSAIPPTKQLQDVYEKQQAPVILLEKVGRNKVSRYGIIDPKPIDNRICEIKDIVEKPAPEKAPSDLAIAGRYLLTPDIFEYISRTKPGHNGEIQLTDALRMMLKDRNMFGLYLDGKRCDIGNKEGFIKANIDFALKRDDVAKSIKEYIKQLAENI